MYLPYEFHRLFICYLILNRHDSHRPSNAWKVRGEFANAIVYPNGKILLIPDTHLEAVCHEADLR